MPVPATQTINVTPVEVDGVWVFNSDGVYPDPVAPNFTPLLVDDFSGGAVGAGYPGFWPSSVYANDQPALSGSSLKIQLNTLTPPACGGGAGYGGRKNLPADIPVGKTIWVKMRRYFPVTHTWSYCYAASDQTEAQACGGDVYDGTTWLKDFVLAPSIATSRIYVSPNQVRRGTAHLDGIRVVSEASHVPDDNMDVKYPLGEWFNTQLMVKVDNTGAGIMRVWINEALVCESVVANISSAENTIREWGIGDYFNGVPYVDGISMTGHYWIQDVIIATDLDGYGAPNATDAGGNVYIKPSWTPGDFS